MPTLKFTDSRGVAWRVWSTVPAATSPLAKYYPGGWLTFDSGGSTLRRLSPAPKEWESCTAERLELMCRVATEVPRHTGEMVKMERPREGPLAADKRPPGESVPGETVRSEPDGEERPTLD